MTEEFARSPLRRWSLALATIAASTLLVSGCAAGQDAGTVNQRPPIDGASADAGDLAVRTAVIVSSSTNGGYAKGGDALLQLVIINNGATTRQLQSVSSPAATGAVLSKVGVPGGQSDTEASATSSDSAQVSTGSSSAAGTSPSATSSPESSSPESASSQPTASAPVEQSTPIDIQAGQTVQIGFSPIGPNISLTGLTTALYPAQTVPVTFGFADGTAITTQLSVALSSNAPSAPVVSEATEPAENSG